MSEQQSPGLNFTEPRTGTTVITGATTSVGGMIGIASQGPINRAVLVGNIDQFGRIFGTTTTGSYLYRAAKAFFDNGGKSLYIVRVGHYSNIDDPTTLDAVKAYKQLTSGGSNSCIFEASSEGAHGDSVGVTTIRQQNPIATIPSNTGTSPITSLTISDVRRMYVGAQCSVSGAAAVAGSVTSSAGPFQIKVGEHWDISINEGANQVWTFGGTRGSKTGSGAVYAGVAGTFVLRFNEDSATDQTITFDGTENSEIKALSKINDQITGGNAVDAAGQIKLQSDRYGTGSNIRVVSGTAGLLTDLGLSTGLGTAGTATITKTGGTGTKTATIAWLYSATSAEIAAAVTLADAVTGGTLVVSGTALVLTTNTTGGTPNGVQVKSSSTNTLGFGTTEHLGSGTATIRFVVTRVDTGTKTVYFSSLTPGADIPASSTVYLEELDVLVYRSGTFLERISSLAMSPLALPKYFLSVINNNDPLRQVAVRTDNGLVASALVDPRPDNQTATLMASGSDGTTPNDTDHIGSAITTATQGGRGLWALDVIDQVNLLAIPGRYAAAVHQALYAYCESRGDVFGILDCPPGQTPQQMVTYVQANLYTEFASIYYPWIKAVDPDTGLLGTYPPCGEIMGVFARVASTRGVQKAPAGTPDGALSLVLGVERTLILSERDLVYPANINPIIALNGKGVLIYGSRTLATSEFRQINVRRVFSYVRRSLKDGLQWVTFEPSDANTRAKVRQEVSTFLLREWRNGLLEGEQASDAFFITCDNTNNPASVELAGQLVCRIGLAVSRPAEFVIFELVQDTRAVDNELAQAGL